MEKLLENLLYRAKQEYYNGTPIMSDEVYDRLEEQLDIGDLSVGTMSGDDGFRYPHAFPMYSLQKSYDENDEPNYSTKTIESPKLDGAAVSILYVNGHLVRALTRGDGKKGLDITEKIKHLVPTKIGAFQSMLQITGEVVAPLTIDNARNYAAGALNLKDIEEFKKRDLSFVAYGVQPSQFDTFSQDMEHLSKDMNTCIDREYEEYPQDGRVFRVDNNKKFEELGYTSHHPRGAYAKKERQEGVVTKLLDVKWQVGKSGAVSPVAILEPCIIGEATVSRATLHNMAIIEALDLEIGCNVEVIRAGEIIPQIIGRAE
jgi:NAD-dependent DNA ligase